MIEVRIYRHDVDEAMAFEKKMKELKEGLESLVAGTKNYHIIGYLGELAVKKYFRAIKIDFTEPCEEYSRHASDSCDLIMGNKKLDVKTSRKFPLITLNERQYYKTQKKEIDYLVGVYFPGGLDRAIITGYGYWQDLIKKDEDYIYNGKAMK